MLLQIGQKPESDFHHPIGMLEDCHKRILFFLKNMIKVASGADTQTLDPGDRMTLEKALRYFREAAPRHTADEEVSLFPRLSQIDDPETSEVFGRIDALLREHRWADEQHLEVDLLCRGWLETRSISARDCDRLRGILSGLLGFYERHIRTEETEVFTVARKLLSESGMESIGREMAERRGLTMCGAPASTREHEAVS